MIAKEADDKESGREEMQEREWEEGIKRELRREKEK